MSLVVRALARILAAGLALATLSCADLLGVEPLTAGDADAAVADAGQPDAASDAAAPACSVAWVDAISGQVPAGAVANAISDAGPTIFICRAQSGNDSLPGKLLPAWGCYYSDGQSEKLAASYQVLVPSRCAVDWAPAPSGIAPPGALECGHDAQGALYACRVGPSGPDPRELGHMGWGTSHACVYSLGGSSLSTGTFEVLTVK